jgi:hypothetical protein
MCGEGVGFGISEEGGEESIEQEVQAGFDMKSEKD